MVKNIIKSKLNKPRKTRGDFAPATYYPNPGIYGITPPLPPPPPPVTPPPSGGGGSIEVWRHSPYDPIIGWWCSSHTTWWCYARWW